MDGGAFAPPTKSPEFLQDYISVCVFVRYRRTRPSKDRKVCVFHLHSAPHCSARLELLLPAIHASKHLDQIDQPLGLSIKNTSSTTLTRHFYPVGRMPAIHLAV